MTTGEFTECLGQSWDLCWDKILRSLFRCFRTTAGPRPIVFRFIL